MLCVHSLLARLYTNFEADSTHGGGADEPEGRLHTASAYAPIFGVQITFDTRAMHFAACWLGSTPS